MFFGTLKNQHPFSLVIKSPNFITNSKAANFYYDLSMAKCFSSLSALKVTFIIYFINISYSFNFLFLVSGNPCVYLIFSLKELCRKDYVAYKDTFHNAFHL